MSRSLNKLQIIGHVGFIEGVQTKGDPMTRVTVATGYSYRSQHGDMIEHTDWHNCVFFGKNAENAIQYLKKGSRVYVEGSVSYQKYTNKDGIEMFGTQVKGQIFIMLDKKDDAQDHGAQQSQQQYAQQSQRVTTKQQQQPPVEGDFIDDEIPF